MYTAILYQIFISYGYTYPDFVACLLLLALVVSSNKNVKNIEQSEDFSCPGTLSDIGVNNIVIRRRDTIGIDPTFLDCDYYRFLKGDIQAVNAFHGEYMKQYSWAELTNGNLYFEYMDEKR
jgi:hypothetical protein